ncbi:MAG TPA: histidine kinase [Puia sp.]|uniref:sensor histidine kinase n=1 Tax=Puia sp. TaxID=2045100 RepID=UPI002BB53B1A|nr:histidine kinase [Puia sp.]HVU94870.1 histidine kinase [Puia sp.]
MFKTRYRYGFILLLAGYTYWNVAFTEAPKYYPIPGSPGFLACIFLFLILAVWEGNRWIEQGVGRMERRRRHPRNGPWATAYPLAIGFGISVVYSGLISALLAYGTVRWAFPAAAARLPILTKLMVTLGTRINLFLHVVHSIYFVSRRLGEKESETEALRRANAQAQLQAIQSQVNPHFLFNNLNVLSALVLQERPEANKFIEEFSIVYRHVLNSQRRDLVPLAEELAFLDHYLFLLHQRFPDGIDIQLDIHPDLRDYLIVPVALQMLIENAIKHNVVSREFPLRITVRTEGDDRLLVENRLRTKTPLEGSTRTGLNNIDQRYTLISRQHINIKKTNEVFSVSLPLIRPVS